MSRNEFLNYAISSVLYILRCCHLKKQVNGYLHRVIYEEPNSKFGYHEP